MKLGLNSTTFNNDTNLLNKLLSENLIQKFEVTKLFYLNNKKYLEKICDSKNCETFSSLIINDYNLNDVNDRKKFLSEFCETCKMASDLGCSNLMFGMARFRENVNDNIYNFFKQLLYVAKEYNLNLLYEALSNKNTKVNWINNHFELIDFSKNLTDKIHIDFGTIKNENEDFGLIYDECCRNNIKIHNVHYSFADNIIPEIILLDLDISLENYTDKCLDEQEIINKLNELKNYIN
jgi:hypothetical protein